MGQYHEIVNLTCRTSLNPRSFGSGLKLMEFGHDCGGPMTALLLLLATEGWGGARIAILGDYGEPTDLPDAVIAETGVDGAAYGSPTLTDASHDAQRLLEARLAAVVTTQRWSDFDFTRIRLPQSVRPAGVEVRICNLDKGQHLDPAAFGQSCDLHLAATSGGKGGVTTALAVLLAAASTCGGRGGGDFHGTSDLVGSWAGDRLIVAPRGLVPATSRDTSGPIKAALAAAQEAAYTTSAEGSVIRLEPPCFQAWQPQTEPA